MKFGNRLIASLLAISLITIGALYLVGFITSPSEESSFLIPTAPLRPFQGLINDIPEEIFPPDVRCDWFVLCGQYVLLNDDDFLLAGDYVEVSQGGFAFMNLTQSQPGRLDGMGCFNPSGQWNAVRVPFMNDDGERFIHRVTIEACIDSVFRLPNGPFRGGQGIHFEGELNCSVKRVSERPIGRDQLVCDDGRIWVLKG